MIIIDRHARRSVSVEHSITFARHPNKHDVVVECSCGFRVKSFNGTDAMRVSRAHIEGERIKEAENGQAKVVDRHSPDD